MARLKLTRFGQVAYRFGSMTPPHWWQEVFQDAENWAEIDGDWEFLLQERADGLLELLQQIRIYGFYGMAEDGDESLDTEASA